MGTTRRGSLSRKGRAGPNSWERDYALSWTLSSGRRPTQRSDRKAPVHKPATANANRKTPRMRWVITPHKVVLFPRPLVGLGQVVGRFGHWRDPVDLLTA